MKIHVAILGLFHVYRWMDWGDLIDTWQGSEHASKGAGISHKLDNLCMDNWEYAVLHHQVLCLHYNFMKYITVENWQNSIL
jgi:hypothetical protein